MDNPESLIKEAENKLTPRTGLFHTIFSGSASQRYEDAGDLFIRAANQYKLRKQGAKAGSAFEKAAEAQIKAENRDEAANSLVDAYKAYKLEDPISAARTLEKAIEFFTGRGQFRRAANFKMDLAQLYREQLSDFPKAIQSYTDAGDWFESDSAQALASKAYLHAADLNALSNKFFPAVEIYRKVVNNSLNNNLAKWSIKDYFVKIVLCYLAGDDRVAATKYFEETSSLDGSFPTTKEHKFLADILESVQDGDADKLSEVVFEYDRFSRLDAWRTSILLVIKNKLSEAEDDLL